jgi:hypothetical protein
MFQSVLLAQGNRALQAQIIRGKGSDGAAFLVGRRLRKDRGRIEDAAEDHLVVRDGAIHDLLALAQEDLDMLWEAVSQ